MSFLQSWTGLLMTHPYFALVPGLRLLSAAGCDVLVLGFDVGNNLLHVQAAAVVHLHHHRGVFDAGLQFMQLLEMESKAKTRLKGTFNAQHQICNISTAKSRHVSVTLLKILHIFTMYPCRLLRKTMFEIDFTGDRVMENHRKVWNTLISIYTRPEVCY